MPVSRPRSHDIGSFPFLPLGTLTLGTQQPCCTGSQAAPWRGSCGEEAKRLAHRPFKLQLTGKAHLRKQAMQVNHPEMVPSPPWAIPAEPCPNGRFLSIINDCCCCLPVSLGVACFAGADNGNTSGGVSEEVKSQQRYEGWEEMLYEAWWREVPVKHWQFNTVLPLETPLKCR